MTAVLRSSWHACGTLSGIRDGGLFVPKPSTGRDRQPSMDARWPPPLTVAIVIHVVTQSFVRAWMACWPGSRYMTIFESYAPGMATKYEYLCEQRPGHDTEITDHMNSRAAEGWELVAAQFTPDHPLPHAWLVWRR